jgi:hypothetical protein
MHVPPATSDLNSVSWSLGLYSALYLINLVPHCRTLFGLRHHDLDSHPLQEGKQETITVFFWELSIVLLVFKNLSVLNKNRTWIMFKNAITALIYHRHKLLDKQYVTNITGAKTFHSRV